MIQRKQTIFLLLAIVFAVVCLCMPIGSIEPKGMGLQSMIWNFGLVVPNQGMNFSHWLLFALLVITIPMEIFAIFQYRNRMVQAKICLWSMLFCLVWYIYYGFVAFSYTQHGTSSTNVLSSERRVVFFNSAPSFIGRQTA